MLVPSNRTSLFRWGMKSYFPPSTYSCVYQLLMLASFCQSMLAPWKFLLKSTKSLTVFNCLTKWKCILLFIFPYLERFAVMGLAPPLLQLASRMTILSTLLNASQIVKASHIEERRAENTWSSGKAMAWTTILRTWSPLLELLCNISAYRSYQAKSGLTLNPPLYITSSVDTPAVGPTTWH